ncbi:MAG: nicotinate phosphoribosyltransferase [Hyphomicrobiales bacterium]|nr:nicotinate phosphoribosyltransferase [Hyphomicrobiales bacterium]
MTLFNNPILDSDSYKYSHFLQYPPDTLNVTSYIEARAGGEFDKLVFFGLQGFLKRYFTQPITLQMIDEAEQIISAHGLPFNRGGFTWIVEQHGGFWPVEIEALPEGLVVPTGIPLVQIKATDDQLPWLPSFLETQLLRAVWYPTTVATLSWHAKQVIAGHLNRTCDDPDPVLPFRLHDFGARGTTSKEQSQIGGAAHLVNFMGTDTVQGLLWAKQYYGADMPGFSIPAAEHSTMTAWGEARETDAYRNMVEQFGGDGRLVAVVSDSYDIYHAVKEIWGTQLKSLVESNGGTVVVRPDSGDPTKVPVDVLDMLMEIFGSRRNGKGYKVLPDCIRVIQGDGMDLPTIGQLLNNLTERKISAENIAFGMGAGLLQKVNRDNLRFAQKANAVLANADRYGDDPVWTDVRKTVKTDPSKSSKAGIQAVTRDNSGIWKSAKADTVPVSANLLEPVYRNGEILRDQTFEEVRANTLLA